MKSWIWLVLFAGLLFLAGCAISDAQLKDIEQTVRTATETVVKTGITIAAPEVDAIAPGASGGIAGLVGAGVAYLVVSILRAIRKTPTPTA